MHLAYDVLKFLQNGKFHSGNDLAAQLRVSRTGIWKAVQFLQKIGLEVYAVPGKGYRLEGPLEMLIRDQICNALSSESNSSLKHFDLLNLTTSTNEYLLQRAHPALLSGYACVAEGQTQGRGRLGRKWISPFGANLYFSLYWHFNLKANELSGLSLAVGLAALNAIKALAQTQDIFLKWPNDLYYKDGKLGGILVETYPVLELGLAEQAKYAAVIGVGLNVQESAVSLALGKQISSLESMLGYKVSRNKLTATLINHIIPVLKRFELAGFSAFKVEWDRYDYLAGKNIVLELPKGQVNGRALGVNERGELCLDVLGRKSAFQCGEASVQFEKK